MPRKQRFKPSRKPQSNQQQVSSQSVDDRKEIIPEPKRETEPEYDTEDQIIRGEPEVE